LEPHSGDIKIGGVAAGDIGDILGEMLLVLPVFIEILNILKDLSKA
jgi:hypothetical protein